MTNKGIFLYPSKMTWTRMYKLSLLPCHIWICHRQNRRAWAKPILQPGAWQFKTLKKVSFFFQSHPKIFELVFQKSHHFFLAFNNWISLLKSYIIALRVKGYILTSCMIQTGWRDLFQNLQHNWHLGPWQHRSIHFCKLLNKWYQNWWIKTECEF